MATLNVRGINYGKLQALLDIMDSHGIDMFTLNESKGWNQEWEKLLQKRDIGVVSTPLGQYRSGVTILYRIKTVELVHISI
jgi:exonuclease III